MYIQNNLNSPPFTFWDQSFQEQPFNNLALETPNKQLRLNPKLPSKNPIFNKLISRRPKSNLESFATSLNKNYQTHRAQGIRLHPTDIKGKNLTQGIRMRETSQTDSLLDNQFSPRLKVKDNNYDLLAFLDQYVRQLEENDKEKYSYLHQNTSVSQNYPISLTKNPKGLTIQSELLPYYKQYFYLKEQNQKIQQQLNKKHKEATKADKTYLQTTQRIKSLEEKLKQAEQRIPHFKKQYKNNNYEDSYILHKSDQSKSKYIPFQKLQAMYQSYLKRGIPQTYKMA